MATLPQRISGILQLQVPGPGFPRFSVAGEGFASMTYISNSGFSAVSGVLETDDQAQPLPQLHRLTFPEEEGRPDEVVVCMPPPVSTLMIEVAKCKKVFTGKLVLPFCSANVTGHLVGGSLNPDKYIPSKVIKLGSCRTTTKIHLPEIENPSKKNQFAVIVFISHYKKYHMMDASWAQFRHLLFTIAPTPCTVHLINNSWGQFLRPGDSGISHISKFAPKLFEQLEGMPCLYMVLFRKSLVSTQPS